MKYCQMTHPTRIPSPFTLAKPVHKSLRIANINYRNGWFFVTVQVEHNKSIFGADLAGDLKKVLPKGGNVACTWGTVGEGK